jgi:glycosyltransferase involved in cell wall biosynthesis
MEGAPVTPSRYRILLMAEAANPEWVSVPLVGWSLSRALAKVADVHLVTHVRNRGAILRTGLIEGRDFTSIDNERVAAPLHLMSNMLKGGAGKGWTTAMAFSSLAYYSFELETWRQFSARIKAREFNIVHRITPLSPTAQSIIGRRLARLGIPFVIGPLNGGVPWPKGFISRQHAEREWLTHLRWLYKLMPGYRSTRRHSTAIIVGSKYTYDEMPHWAKEKCVYIPENGVDLNVLEFPRDRSEHHPLKAAFVGRLVPYKGADLLLQAAAEVLRNGQLELHIIGDGPQKEFLEMMAERLCIRDRVRFHGWLPHFKVQQKLITCDLMILPSVREFGGGVVVEAMALGVTPIVADYAGPSELVDEKTGIRVPFQDEKSLVEGLRLAIGNIVRSPEILERLGAAAREKVRAKLTWQAKASQILAVYDAVLSGAKNLGFLDYQRDKSIIRRD